MPLILLRKDGSKEPIVEMRTEDERITNHEDGSPVNEPNETTPLTEPEYVFWYFLVISLLALMKFQCGLALRLKKKF